jgi:hypothetical protein
MAKTIEDLFILLLFLTDLLFILCFFLFFKKSKLEKPLLALFLYCLLDIIVNSITELPVSRLLLFISYAFFTAFEYLVFAFILWLNIKNNTFRKLIAYISIFFVIFLCFYNSITEPRSIDSIPIGMETIFILIYSFYYLYEQMKETNNFFIYNKYQFWIVTGIMIYLSGAFFIYIFANQVDKVTLNKFWFLTNAFYVIKNIFFGIGLMTLIKKPKKTFTNQLHPSLS